MIRPFLRLFNPFIELEKAVVRFESESAEGVAEMERLSLKLRDTERALEIMTDARLNLDKSHEFLKGELEALKQAHVQEVLGLHKMIDAFSPSAIGRTVFGLAPEPKAPMEEVPAQGARTRRTTQREALEMFMAEANQRAQSKAGLDPNPNGDVPADFSVKH